ncbi:hypothetical protein Bpfe_014582, partial [Biomphalaria pfeifferi]
GTIAHLKLGAIVDQASQHQLNATGTSQLPSPQLRLDSSRVPSLRPQYWVRKPIQETHRRSSLITQQQHTSKQK